MLRVAGIEGPLDWVLEQARAGRIDLARLPVLALVEQCVAAIAAALAPPGVAASEGRGGGDLAPPPVQRLGEWLVMAAWLVWLRSRLLLPADDPEAQAARAEAEALRRGLADRTRVRNAVAWLDAQPQLGRDVFARGRAGSSGTERAIDLPALLRTYARLMGPPPAPETMKAYCPRPPRLWRVPDALARIVRLLPKRLGAAASESSSLWSFLPDTATLAATGLAPGTVPDPALLCRSAVASTLVAGLELARQGQITLAQDEAFGGITVHGASGMAAAGAKAGFADGS